MTASFLPFGFLLALFCYKDKHPANMFLLGGFTMSMSYTVGVVCASYYAAGYGMIVLQALILTASVFISLTTLVFVTKKDFSFMGQGLFAGLILLIVWGALLSALCRPGCPCHASTLLMHPSHSPCAGFLQSFIDFGPGGRMIFSLIGSLIFVGCEPLARRNLTRGTTCEQRLALYPAWAAPALSRPAHIALPVLTAGRPCLAADILYDTSMIMHYMGPDDYIMAAVTLYLDIINLFLYLLELLRMLQGGDN